MIRFINIDCEVRKSFYPSGQIFLKLEASETEHNLNQDVYPCEPVAYASAPLEDVALPDNHTVIKDYAENEGMLDALLAGQVVNATGKVIDNGYVSLPVVEVLI